MVSEFHHISATYFNALAEILRLSLSLFTLTKQFLFLASVTHKITACFYFIFFIKQNTDTIRYDLLSTSLITLRKYNGFLMRRLNRNPIVFSQNSNENNKTNLILIDKSGKFVCICNVLYNISTHCVNETTNLHVQLGYYTHKIVMIQK